MIYDVIRLIIISVGNFFLCDMYSVQFTVYTVHCTLYSVHYTLSTICIFMCRDNINILSIFTGNFDVYY